MLREGKTPKSPTRYLRTLIIIRAINDGRGIFKFGGGNKRLRNVTKLYYECQISQRRS
jgi:hypothetical protein